MDKQLTAQICLISNRAKAEGFETVSAWMQRHLAEDIRADRSRKPRTRGVKVRLAKARGALAVLDEKRMRELIEE